MMMATGIAARTTMASTRAIWYKPGALTDN